MNDSIRIQLMEFYQRCKISPEHFDCPHQDFCRSFAFQNEMTETKMSMVGSQYGGEYPKIVVVSLDPPYGNQGAFVEPNQRTTEYVTARHEADDYTLNRPNPHWAMTQIIVKDILCLFGFKAQGGTAVVAEGYAGRPIENVSKYFAHVNVAKCSMNNKGKRQANKTVHSKCSDSYLREELVILEPDILITQGTITNEIMSLMLEGRMFQESDLRVPRLVNTGSKPTLWLLMRHPARQLGKIREDWPFCVPAIQEWKSHESESV